MDYIDRAKKHGAQIEHKQVIVATEFAFNGRQHTYKWCWVAVDEHSNEIRGVSALDAAVLYCREHGLTGA